MELFTSIYYLAIMDKLNVIIKRFNFRFDTSLFKSMIEQSNRLGINTNKLVRDALNSAFIRYAGGWQHFLEQSDFLQRDKIKDKKNFQVLLTEDEKEMLLKLAFTLRKSMAEILRCVIEYYVFVVNSKNESVKYRYSKKSGLFREIVPLIVLYEIVRPYEEQYFIFNKPPDYHLEFT